MCRRHRSQPSMNTTSPMPSTTRTRSSPCRECHATEIVAKVPRPSSARSTVLHPGRRSCPQPTSRMVPPAGAGGAARSRARPGPCCDDHRSTAMIACADQRVRRNPGADLARSAGYPHRRPGVGPRRSPVSNVQLQLAPEHPVRQPSSHPFLQDADEEAVRRMPTNPNNPYRAGLSNEEIRHRPASASRSSSSRPIRWPSSPPGQVGDVRDRHRAGGRRASIACSSTTVPISSTTPSVGRRGQPADPQRLPACVV